MQWWIQGGGGARDRRSSRGPNSFNFMQFLGKCGKSICWHPVPPQGWHPQPRGNPGSATGMGFIHSEYVGGPCTVMSKLNKLEHVLVTTLLVGNSARGVSCAAQTELELAFEFANHS